MRPLVLFLQSTVIFKLEIFMDFNDIALRFKRTIASIDGRFDENISGNIHVQFKKKYKALKCR